MNADTTTNAAATAPAGSGDEAATAYAELATTLGDIEKGYVLNDATLTDQQRAARRYLVANALQHGFQCWFDSDPDRPRP